MPKTYPAPESREKHERESTPRKGVYETPERTGLSREILIAIAVVVALLIVFVLYRWAQGEEGSQWQPSGAPPDRGATVST